MNYEPFDSTGQYLYVFDLYGFLVGYGDPKAFILQVSGEGFALSQHNLPSGFTMQAQRAFDAMWLSQHKVLLITQGIVWRHAEEWHKNFYSRGQ